MSSFLKCFLYNVYISHTENKTHGVGSAQYAQNLDQPWRSCYKFKIVGYVGTRSHCLTLNDYDYKPVPVAYLFWTIGGVLYVPRLFDVDTVLNRFYLDYIIGYRVVKCPAEKIWVGYFLCIAAMSGFDVSHCSRYCVWASFARNSSLGVCRQTARRFAF